MKSQRRLRLSPYGLAVPEIQRQIAAFETPILRAVKVMPTSLIFCIQMGSIVAMVEKITYCLFVVKYFFLYFSLDCALHNVYHMGMAKGCGFTLIFNRRPVEYIYFEVHDDHLVVGIEYLEITPLATTTIFYDRRDEEVAIRDYEELVYASYTLIHKDKRKGNSIRRKVRMKARSLL